MKAKVLHGQMMHFNESNAKWHPERHIRKDMAVSKNRRTPKSSILIGFSIINHPFWGTPIFGNTHMFHL